MSEITQITDHVAQAKARLPEKNRKPNTEDYIDVMASKIQEYEDTIFEMLSVLTLEGAYGIFLDRFGEHLLVERGNDGDALYKSRIQTAIYEKTKAGQIDVLIAAYKNLIGNVPIFLDEYYPHTVIMTATTDLPIPNESVINNALQRVKAAGIELAVGVTPTRGFKLSALKNQMNTGNGFASSPVGSGQGKFARLLE